MKITAPSEAKRLQLFHLFSLFFPGEGDAFSIRCEKTKAGFSVTLKKGKTEARGEASLLLSRHLEAKRAENVALARAFAESAKAFTDLVPPYGLLYGVRPVKTPLFYLNRGWDEGKVLRLLEEDFMVSPEKASLLLSLAETERAFEKSLSPGDALLYISIPFCPSRCRYCSFISSAAPRHLALIPEYLERLKEEISLTAELCYAANRTLRAVYIGGGTPGILSAEQLSDLLSHVRGSFDFSSLREFTVEMGRPDVITAKKLSVLKEKKVTRISVNPQTTRDETLRLIGRNHSARDFFEAMESAKKTGFDSINCDLIAGLEGETPEDFLSSLSQVLSLSPEEVTLHALCKKRAAEVEDIPTSQSWQTGMEKAHRLCINRGLSPYYLYRQKNAAANLENTGFARDSSLGVYNLAMMEDLCDVFACGAGGIGKILPKEAGGKIRRFAEPKFPFEYLAFPERTRTRLEEMKRFL